MVRWEYYVVGRGGGGESIFFCFRYEVREFL